MPDTADLFDDLVSENVLVPDGETLTYSAGFRETVRAYESSVTGHDGQSLEDAVDELVAAENELGAGDRDVLVELGRGDPALLATYCGLVESLPGYDQQDRIGAVFTLDQVEEPRPRTEGAPAMFLPARGEYVPTLMNLFRAALVYVWSEDCEPCDVMYETFEEIFEEPPGDVLLLAVYGPASEEFLRERYDVVGAPTMLFTLDGAVDSRLQGPQYPSTVLGEVSTVREIVGSDSSQNRSDGEPESQLS